MSPIQVADSCSGSLYHRNPPLYHRNQTHCSRHSTGKFGQEFVRTAHIPRGRRSCSNICRLEIGHLCHSHQDHRYSNLMPSSNKHLHQSVHLISNQKVFLTIWARICFWTAIIITGTLPPEKNIWWNCFADRGALINAGFHRIVEYSDKCQLL